MARRVLSERPARRPKSLNTRRATHLDRDQRDLLRLAEAGKLPQMGGDRARRLCVFRQGTALCHQPARARRGRRLDQALSQFRRARARRPAGADAVAVRADQEIRRRGFRRIPRTAAGESRRPALRHVVEVRHASFLAPDFVALARAFARRSCSPTTRDIHRSPTRPAISSMRGCRRGRRRFQRPIRRRNSTPGQSGCACGRKVTRRRTCPTSSRARAAKAAPRDVFAYVIHEGKIRAPAAAMALIERLKQGE